MQNTEYRQRKKTPEVFLIILEQKKHQLHAYQVEMGAQPKKEYK